MGSLKIQNLLKRTDPGTADLAESLARSNWRVPPRSSLAACARAHAALTRGVNRRRPPQIGNRNPENRPERLLGYSASRSVTRSVSG